MARHLHLFGSKKNEAHKCTIITDDSKSFLPRLPPNANFFQRFQRALKKSTLISERNPQSTEYFRSKGEIINVRKDHVKSKTFIIHPFSVFRAYYEIYMSVMWCYILLWAPGVAAFDIDINSDGGPKPFKVYKIFPNLICIVDIVLTFLTGYTVEKKRIVVMNPTKIARHYAFSYLFVCDVISSIPEPWFADNGPQRFISCFGFLKIVRLPTFFRYVSRSGEFLHFNKNVVPVVKNTILIYIIFHWFACLHFLVPQIRYYKYGAFEQGSWVLTLHITEKHDWSRYIISLYRCSGALLSVTFDRTPLELWEEKMFFIFTFLFGKVFVFYIVVVVLHQLLNHSSLETKYYETISQVKSFMSQRHLSLSMQKRLLQFYDYKYNKKYFKEDSITGLLSDKLKGEINISVRSKVVQNVALLANLPENTLEQVVASLTTEIFLPNDLIIKAGSFGDCMYFLSSGTVAVWTPSGKEICHLQDGAYFGEISLLFKDQKRTANIVAIEICEVYKLDRKIFKSCFKGNAALLKLIEDVANERLEMTQMYEDLHAKKFMEKDYAQHKQS